MIDPIFIDSITVTEGYGPAELVRAFCCRYNTNNANNNSNNADDSSTTINNNSKTNKSTTGDNKKNIATKKEEEEKVDEKEEDQIQHPWIQLGWKAEFSDYKHTNENEISVYWTHADLGKSYFVLLSFSFHHTRNTGP